MHPSVNLTGKNGTLEEFETDKRGFGIEGRRKLIASGVISTRVRHGIFWGTTLRVRTLKVQSLRVQSAFDPESDHIQAHSFVRDLWWPTFRGHDFKETGFFQKCFSK